MPDVSPTKWHRAHVSWFFETFILGPNVKGFRPFNDGYAYIFNSYYEALGDRHPRNERGLISRPGIEEISRYRHFVDEAMQSLLQESLEPGQPELVTLGLHHEQQHQELLLMDIKHVLSRNPLRPAYLRQDHVRADTAPPKAGWIDHEGGLTEIGHGGQGFGFDNEFPRHPVHLNPFALADRPVTCGEWLSFMEDGGYSRPEFWLSDGWSVVMTQGWRSPLYWFTDPDEPDLWLQFTLSGVRPVDPDEPVCHVSYYEADAFAHWTGMRLPTEAEWEAVATTSAAGDNFLGDGLPHPRPAIATNALFGDVWEWTSSAYTPYPGFRAASGAVGEYNGKFMVSQYVLRGGCCATPPGHTRDTYRNFFPPGARWQFGGVRLARDP
jgi:ergothioneine biosynthesis protein EgtB